ncbi:MAG TPA: FMN-binding negative transcriptional regulator [Chitinophagales bacterium]|nr:FMN-binding negative transcriptional regulator [Chitinophagales bacterium]
MYIPSYFAENNWQIAVAFMQQYNFATLVSVGQQAPRATHLPFVVEYVDEQLNLYTHLSALNEQQHDFAAEQELLVIFQEPHAYISPRLYDKRQSVPTWNYVAVHVYGKASLLTNEADKIGVLEKMIQQYEASYQQQWDALSPKYKNGLLRGIVAIKITVERIEAAYKLSQNKSSAERVRIAHTLQDSSDSVVQQTGAMMLERLP